MSTSDILVIDDDEMMTLFLAEYLGSQHNVSVYSSAAEAQNALLAGAHPTLIIMDLSMPDMDGFAMLNWLKEGPNFSDIPVLVLSGSEKSEDRVTCLRLGAADFLQKPFNPEELQARVNLQVKRPV